MPFNVRRLAGRVIVIPGKKPSPLTPAQRVVLHFLVYQQLGARFSDGTALMFRWSTIQARVTSPSASPSPYWVQIALNGLYAKGYVSVRDSDKPGDQYYGPTEAGQAVCRAFFKRS